MYFSYYTTTGRHTLQPTPHSSRGIRIDVHVLSVSWYFEDHSVIIQAPRKGPIEHEASDTGGVPRWKSSCPDRLAEATARTAAMGNTGKTVFLRWVGAPNGRAPFRFHGAVVGFVARCLSRTRSLAASNKHLAEFLSGRSWSKIGPGFFSGFLKSLKLFFWRFALIASGKEIFWRVSFKF